MNVVTCDHNKLWWYSVQNSLSVTTPMLDMDKYINNAARRTLFNLSDILGTIRTYHYVNDFWWLFRIKLSALFCSNHNGLIQFNRNSIMINDCNISTAMFVNGESNGKSIQRFILITQSHMITLAVPYIILSTILINGEPFSIMFSIFILSPDNTVRSLLLVQYPIWC